MRNGLKEPLFRKENRTARCLHPGRGGEYRWQRNSKSEKAREIDEVSRGKMRGLQRGLDYTPLFRFLLSRVGKDWPATHSEAVARLITAEPIYWMVAMRSEDRRRYFRAGENSYFSGLYVTEDKFLALTDPDLTLADMRPDCDCCTHTLNGRPFTQPFDPENRMTFSGQMPR